MTASPTGRRDAIARSFEPGASILLFSGRVITQGVVQAGNIAAPGALTNRDLPTPLAGLSAGAVSINKDNKTDFDLIYEMTDTGATGFMVYAIIPYFSDDGVEWRLTIPGSSFDIAGLSSGNPNDFGFGAAGGTVRRATFFLGLADLTARYLAIAVRNDSVPLITLTSLRLVRRR